jgi:hypothetical protein
VITYRTGSRAAATLFGASSLKHNNETNKNSTLGYSCPSNFLSRSGFITLASQIDRANYVGHPGNGWNTCPIEYFGGASSDLEYAPGISIGDLTGVKIHFRMGSSDQYIDFLAIYMSFLLSVSGIFFVQMVSNVVQPFIHI